MPEDKNRDKKRDKRRDTKTLSTVYESDDERKRERRVRKSETGTSSQYASSHATTSRSTKVPSEASTAKESRRGPPPSKSAGLSFVDPNAPRSAASVAPSITSLSSRGHKSATVVGKEVARRDQLYDIDDWEEREAAVEKFRAKMKQKQGSLGDTEKSDKISDYVDKTIARVPKDRVAAAAAELSRYQAPSEKSYTPSVKSHASKATRDSRDSRTTSRTKDTRDSRHSKSEVPSSRDSHGRRSTADRRDRDRSPRRHYTSTTMIAISGDANVAIHDHEQGTSTYISSSSGKHHNSPRPGYIPHPSDARYRAPSLPQPQLTSRPRIEEVGSVSGTSYGSESTAKPLRIGNGRIGNGSTGDWPFESSDSGVKTITGSEASRLMGRPASSRGGYPESTGRSQGLEPIYEIREPRWATQSASASSKPAPSLSNYGSQYGGSKR
ncbi:uncharacterized protein EAF02_011755 [Botrytis sinoallii]|uniref:uncharacterized protein n=1 Tax=Botrytis sinoallii TaxID=1463999 RepID=UPI00190108C0|nr:uncharacterized protein EAF02_011755 [Botrytis sinoallii]KAF7854137.1 hypothetical protein EAF02_011755 [Botrytis sinoallii]